MRTQREVSKVDTKIDGVLPSIEEINSGSLQRIADATEKMAMNYTQLIADRDLYKRWNSEAIKEKEMAYRRISALQGVITKLKKQLAQQNNNK